MTLKSHNALWYANRLLHINDDNMWL